MSAAPELRVHHPAPEVAVVDVTGELTAGSGDALCAAYAEADRPGVRGVVLNFSALSYMNSGGLGVLVTVLVRANRHQQRVVAYGLQEHYRQIMRVTRLDEAIRLADDEAGALAAAGASR